MRIVRGTVAPVSGLSGLETLRREMERVLERAGTEDQPRDLSAWACPAEVVENGNEIRFAVELPGVRPADVELTVENRVMSIAGEKRLTREEADASAYRLAERRYGHFERSFVLPESASTEEIEADFENGVLTVTVPKRAESKARRIEIAVSGS